MKKFWTMALLCLLLVFGAACTSNSQGGEVVPDPADGIPVLLYHHLIPQAQNRLHQDNPYVISTEQFREQMQYLYDNGFQPITLSQLEAYLYDDAPLPPNSVMIHFDDGYYSNFVYAYPILQEFGFEAVLFLLSWRTEYLGDTQPPLDYDAFTWPAAHTIAAASDVFETASHTHNMHDLREGTNDTILATADHEDILEDLHRSFDFVSNHRAFTYPKGQYNETVIAALQAGGITMAFTTRAGYITRSSDPFSLERFTITNTTSFEEFQRIVHGRGLAQ